MHLPGKGIPDQAKLGIRIDADTGVPSVGIQEILTLIEQRKQLVGASVGKMALLTGLRGDSDSSATAQDTTRWTCGKITGAVYHGGQESGAHEQREPVASRSLELSEC